MSVAKLLNLLRTHSEQPSTETDTVRKIVRQLDQLEPARARYVAAFAYLLSRVARADLHISEAETSEMERLIVENSGLPEEQAILVVQIAKTQATLFGGTETFLVTQEFNDMATDEQKIKVLRCLFAVAAADKSISAAEDHEIREIARELLLTHMDYINVRLEFRQKLAVLQNPE